MTKVTTRAELLGKVYDNTNAIHGRLREHFEHVMSRIELSPSQIHLLFIVEALQPVNSKKLAATMRLTPGAISQLVDALGEKDYIQRENDKTDRRVSYITLSPQGKKLVVKCQRARNILLTEAMQSLDDEELEQLTHIQDKLLQDITNKETEKTTRKGE